MFICILLYTSFAILSSNGALVPFSVHDIWHSYEYVLVYAYHPSQRRWKIDKAIPSFSLLSGTRQASHFVAGRGTGLLTVGSFDYTLAGSSNK